MDDEIRKSTRECINRLRSVSIENIDYDNMDPIAKMMLMAVIHEGQKIRDDIAAVPRKIVERYCADFVPYEKVEAMPAISVLRMAFKPRSTADSVSVDSGVSFLYKNKGSRLQLNYLPLFPTQLLPYNSLFVISHSRMRHDDISELVAMEPANRVWLGIASDTQIETLKGLSLFIKGTRGVLPVRVAVAAPDAVEYDLEMATMQEMENIGLLEPFDAQQSSGQFFAITERWKEQLLNMDDAAIMYITDGTCNRDYFKPHAYPKAFQLWLEEEALDQMLPNTLWLQLDFPSGYVVPDDISIAINVLPVVNVDVSSVTLTQTVPIAKLQKNDNSFFLRVLETSTSSHRQGFNMTTDEVVIRDFDASRYNNGDLYRDVRMLFNRFLDDYYAFTEYNGIKDGEVLRHLREIVNRLGKSVGVQNDTFHFDSGTYVMRSISQEDQATTTKVTFMTTQGEIGNTPKTGETMENRRLPAILQKVDIIAAATGGTNKASIDARYELLRYYALTNDRLYTRMDVDAFLRKEVMLAFGHEEYHRIIIRMKIEGSGGQRGVQRGLYITLEFKDKINYEQACRLNFDILMQQRITNLSCIAMPIIVKLVNLEG